MDKKNGRKWLLTKLLAYISQKNLNNFIRKQPCLILKELFDVTSAQVFHTQWESSKQCNFLLLCEVCGVLAKWPKHQVQPAGQMQPNAQERSTNYLRNNASKGVYLYLRNHTFVNSYCSKSQHRCWDGSTASKLGCYVADSLKIQDLLWGLSGLISPASHCFPIITLSGQTQTCLTPHWDTSDISVPPGNVWQHPDTICTRWRN